MSKSIYEEAIEIMMNSILPRESNKTNKLKVIKAIKKAQKQEKLLELYRKLTTVKDELISIAWFDGSCDETEEMEADLKKRIKELENDK